MPFFNIFSNKKVKEKEKPKIIADNREKNSLVIANLIELGAEVEFKQLEIADYLVQDTAIERKTCSDFIGSMLNKRLIQQLHNIQSYNKKLLIIEGDKEELYNYGIHKNAVKGMLLAVSLELAPIIFTQDAGETASFLFLLSKKQEQGSFSLHARKPQSLKEQQEYILESFQGIGPKTSKKLLKEFKTIKAIINAPIEELEKLIGKKAEVFKLVEKEY